MDETALEGKESAPPCGRGEGSTGSGTRQWGLSRKKRRPRACGWRHQVVSGNGLHVRSFPASLCRL
jgi:hypothetical protein